MWTIKYKKGFIHGYGHTDQCYAQYGSKVRLCTSMKAAKSAIARWSK